MARGKYTELELEIIQKVKAARELGYSSHAIEELRNAKSVAETDRIMINARKEKWND